MKDVVKKELTRRGFLAVGGGVAVAAGALWWLPNLASAISTDITESSGTYVCPPCGQPCDKLTFDKPGTCPQCGMTLIDKADADAVPTVSILLFDRAEIID